MIKRVADGRQEAEAMRTIKYSEGSLRVERMGRMNQDDPRLSCKTPALIIILKFSASQSKR